jgi:hypothetical protein
MEFDGFSIVPPAAEGWMAMKPVPQVTNTLGITARASFIKILAKPSPPSRLHRLTAVVRTAYLTDVNARNDRESLRAIASGFSGRSRLDKCLVVDCARYESMMDDPANPSYPGHVFIIDKHGFVLFHPDSPGFMINVEYRQYYGRDAQALTPDALEREVEPFQRSLTFTALRSAQRLPTRARATDRPMILRLTRKSASVIGETSGAA